jgi:hypothetical protein
MGGYKMSLKFYLTDWIPEIGRYAIMTTAFQNPKTKHYTCESFIFALDKEGLFFDGLRAAYTSDDPIPGYDDEPSMHKEALGYARNMIHLHNHEVYKKTNNRDIILKEWKPYESGSGFTVLGEIRRKYEDKLKELAEHSWSDELKQTISFLLRIKIKLEPYPFK